MPFIGKESPSFAGQCFCETPSSVGMGERAGWPCWECPECGAHHDLEHFYAEDGRYLWCSWVGDASVGNGQGQR